MKTDRIINAVQGILGQDRFTNYTVRELFYLLQAKKVIWGEKAYKRLDECLVKGREIFLEDEKDALAIDYRRILESGRGTTEFDGGFHAPEDYMDAAIEQLKNKIDYYPHNRSYWYDQPKHVEVWLEKEAIADRLSPLCRKWKVSLTPAHGFSSFTQKMICVNRMLEQPDEEHVILYLGDFDPTGLVQYNKLKQHVNRYIHTRNPNIHVDVKWVCLTEKQMEDYGLPWESINPKDPNIKKFFAETGMKKEGHIDAFVLTSRGQQALLDILEEAIKQEVDMKIWNETERKKVEEDKIFKKLFREKFGVNSS